MLSLKSSDRTSLECSQHCFLGAQTVKQLLLKQNVETFFVSEKQKKNVSATNIFRAGANTEETTEITGMKF